MSISVSKEFESITEFKQELAKYIKYYNHERIKEKSRKNQGKIKGNESSIVLGSFPRGYLINRPF